MRGKWEIADSGKQLESVLKETHVVSIMRYRLLETGANLRTIVLSRPKFEGKHRRKGKIIQTIRQKGRRFFCSKERRNCTNPSCNERHPPMCQNYISETGCKCGEKFHFRHIELEEKPNKKSKKDSAKGSVALLRELTLMNCVSQDPHPKNSILRREGQLGSSHTVKFSRGTWRQIKIRERKGPSLGIIQKCEPYQRSPCAPKFVERSQAETLQQERCARRVAWNLAKNLYKLKNVDKTTFYCPVEARAMLGAHFTITKGARIRGRFRSFNACDEQET